MVGGVCDRGLLTSRQLESGDEWWVEVGKRERNESGNQGQDIPFKVTPPSDNFLQADPIF
jgi:hypothetical protein